jgi:hypothetical protein
VQAKAYAGQLRATSDGDAWLDFLTGSEEAGKRILGSRWGWSADRIKMSHIADSFFQDLVKMKAVRFPDGVDPGGSIVSITLKKEGSKLVLEHQAAPGQSVVITARPQDYFNGAVTLESPKAQQFIQEIFSAVEKLRF